MNIVRFINDSKNIALGIWENEKVYDLTSILKEKTNDVMVLHEKVTEKGQSLSSFISKLPYQETSKVYDYQSINLITPVEAVEVWACGVTYENSRMARNSEMEELTEGSISFYDKVYDAVRPEIFFKSTAARTVAPNKSVCIRSDSNWQIPEPEVALVLSQRGEIIGYTAGNDMSSRDIEGENPLYLPQAKVWRNSCSFGPSIRLADTVQDPYNLDIQCRIFRNGELMVEGEANTSQLKRKYEELVEFLGRDNPIFTGTVLFTGTCIIPPDEFTLQEGDRIEIEVSGVGVLINDVKNTASIVSKTEMIK
ncbi:fumarylacetoacetate hydrolase family protein [Salipaludibacillus sp. HK11]|uniref:fumarylacetoacetate hydrolase family protein n=1 Tax=Salipaludibacillus sp. HK11 TaxID=3394320 RepID=UPI0039FC8B7F